MSWLLPGFGYLKRSFTNDQFSFPAVRSHVVLERMSWGLKDLWSAQMSLLWLSCTWTMFSLGLNQGYNVWFIKTVMVITRHWQPSALCMMPLPIWPNVKNGAYNSDQYFYININTPDVNILQSDVFMSAILGIKFHYGCPQIRYTEIQLGMQQISIIYTCPR